MGKRRHRYYGKKKGSGEPQAFPKNRKVHMRYIDTIALDPSVGGGIAQLTWKLNDIFDPYQTGAGHQPNGHDEWGQFYGNYVVQSCGVKLTACSNTNQTHTMSPSYLVASLGVTPTLVTADLQDIIEQGDRTTKWAMIPQNNSHGPTVINHYFSAKNFFNISDIKDNADDIGALYFNSPDKVCYLNIASQIADGLQDPWGITVTVELDYTVILGDPLRLPPS